MSKGMPTISVIMGVYNQTNREYLLGAIQSIINQTYRDIEFIIYDDGSNPEEKEFLNRFKNLDERIIIIGRDENNGLAFSLNECIKKSRGKYIARMDSDDLSKQDRLQIQYDFMESHPEYAWCGCNAELFDEMGTWGERQMPEKPEYEDYLKYSPYIHPTVMYRREIFEIAGSYLVSEETLRCEDYEIFMRLRIQGHKGYNIQQKLFCYREDKSSYSRRTLKARINEAKLRQRNFKQMGMLWPKGWIYVLRPIIGGILTPRVVAWIKRRESRK